MSALVLHLRSPAVALAVVALVGACSGLDRGEFTDNLAEAVCNKAWQCLEPQVVESSSSLYGRSRAECSATYEKVFEPRCAAGSDFDEDQAQTCVDQVNALNCSQLMLTGSVVLPYSCTLACRASATDAGGTDAARPRTDGSVPSPVFDGGGTDGSGDAEPPAGEPDAASLLDAGVDAAASEPDAAVDAGA